jgi:hypothetical protein
MTDAEIALEETGAISSSKVSLSFDDVSLHSTESSNIVVGDRSVDFFFDPNNYPISYDGVEINIEMHWKEEEETMFVQAEGGCSASVEVDEMTDPQKMTALLYLIGVVTDER